MARFVPPVPKIKALPKLPRVTKPPKIAKIKGPPKVPKVSIGSNLKVPKTGLRGLF